LQEYLDYKLQKSPSAGSEKIKENQPQETKKQVSSETTSAALVKPKLDKAKQKLEREISNLEQQIEQQERLITDIENELGELDYENKQQYNLVLNRYETEKTNLEALYHKWELKQNELTEV
jgi:predicted RNase H-like nuclease (RuvC/YqgF family)